MKIFSTQKVKFTISGIQSKSTKHKKKQGNITHEMNDQSIKIDP